MGFEGSVRIGTLRGSGIVLIPPRFTLILQTKIVGQSMVDLTAAKPTSEQRSRSIVSWLVSTSARSYTGSQHLAILKNKSPMLHLDQT